MAIVVPDISSRGYTMTAMKDIQVDEVFGSRQSPLHKYFTNLSRQHDFSNLIDTWIRYDERVGRILKATEGVSKHMYKHMRGKLINSMLRRYVLFLMNPQQYANAHDYVLAANFSYMKMKLEKHAFLLNLHYLNEENKLPRTCYNLNLKKYKIIKLSKLWCDKLLPIAEHIHKRMIEDGYISEDGKVLWK